MKYLVPILTILLLLAGCNYSTYRPIGTPYNPTAISDRFINVRLLSHNKDVNIYLPNESLPDSMVLPVRLVEEKCYYDGYTNLINKVKASARKQGLDGVIILERDFINEVWEGSSSTYQVATGIGFIYKNTLNQVKLFPKRKYVEIWKNGAWHELASLAFSTYGGVVKTRVVEDSILEKEYFSKVVRFDLDVLRSIGGKNWYRKESPNKVNNLHEVFYSKRYKSPAGSYMIEVEEIRFLSKYKYMGAPVLIEHKTISRPKENGRKEVVTFQHKIKYNKKGWISEIIITQKKPTKAAPFKLIQRFEYDNRNRRVASVWYREENGKELPFAKMQYDYYAPEDFIPSLRFAPDIPMRASASSLNKG